MGEYCRDNKIGFHAMTKEQRSLHSKKIYAEGKGLSSLTHEQKSLIAKKAVQKTNTQRWKCTITGKISTPGGLSKYQQKRQINTSNRIRIQ